MTQIILSLLTAFVGSGHSHKTVPPVTVSSNQSLGTTTPNTPSQNN